MVIGWLMGSMDRMYILNGGEEMKESKFGEAQVDWARGVNKYLHKLLKNKWIEKEWIVVLQHEGDHECEVVFRDCIYSIALGEIAKLNDEKHTSGYVTTIKWDGKVRPCLRIC